MSLGEFPVFIHYGEYNPSNQVCPEPEQYRVELSADCTDLVGKPAPDLFIYAAKQLGFAPDQCIAIEDSVNGVKSARAAGMNVIGFVGGGHCRASHSGYLSNAGATIIVDHMDQILEALEALISAS